jgi:predicted nucleic acid-binding protein
LKVDHAFRNVKRFFLDTAPVIYYVEKNPRYLTVATAIFDRVDNGTLTVVTSPVTLAECLAIPYRSGLVNLQQDFLDLLVHGRNTFFAPIDHNVAREAAELRARYNLTLLDALQVSLALNAGCQAFLTNDAALRRVSEISILVLDDLEV